MNTYNTLNVRMWEVIFEVTSEEIYGRNGVTWTAVLCSHKEGKGCVLKHINLVFIQQGQKLPENLGIITGVTAELQSGVRSEMGSASGGY